MASEIDPTQPPAIAPTTSGVRLQFARAKAEINAITAAAVALAVRVGLLEVAPPAHAAAHQPTGSDAMAVDAAAATGSLRTIGTVATQACGGTDARLSNARTPTAHATSHKHGGTDEIATATPAANAIPKADAAGLLDGWITPPAVVKATSWKLSDQLTEYVTDTGNGAANRINTRSFVLPVAMDVSFIVVRAISDGGGTDLAGLGLYTAAGALVLRTAAIATDGVSGWSAANRVHVYAVYGGPVTVAPGTYIWAWTVNGVNARLQCSAALAAAEYEGADNFEGYDSAVSVAGVLPATLNLSFTFDASRGKPWFALRA